MLPAIDKFAGQNWLMTPVSGDPSGASGPTAADQRWLLILSGVAFLEFKGNSGSQWRRETVRLSPTLQSAFDEAMARYHVPTPRVEFFRSFQAEQWAPFVGLSSMFDKNQAVNAGFAVDTWRPAVFGERAEATSSTMLGNLWRGIEVDVAVRDSDAIIHRLSYSISLIGRIVFTKPF